MPFVETHLQPVGAPTDAYPGVMFPGTPRWLGAWGRRTSHRLSELAIWKPFEGAMRAARRDVLGLGGRAPDRVARLQLYGFSRHVVPVPDDGSGRRHATGYWFLPAPDGWAPPTALERFLASPGPVVSIGFGSMSSEDPARLTELVRGAVRRAGARALLLSGWGGLAHADGEDLLSFDALPHDWLFPRVAAIVHHGGAGTTGAALRSGRPSLVVPFTMDQPFWGSRVAELGVGPAPIARASLTEESLARALTQALSDEAMQRRAAELGEAIREEDGVGEAALRLERAVRPSSAVSAA